MIDAPADGVILACQLPMPRHPRVQFPGAVYHVTGRGNRKSMIVDDDDDRRTFIKEFTDAVQDYAVRVYSHCLMGTHYHTVVDTPRGNLSEFVQTLNSEYSKAFNRRHHRVGHTFEQRFGSTVVQREKYLRRVARYVAVNPVKAGLRRDPAEWPWSTHRATAGLEPAPPWLYVDWLRWAFRADTLADAQRRYLEYVRDPTGLTWSFDPTPVLGTRRFQRAVGKLLESRETDRCIPRDCRHPEQPSLEQIFADEEPDIRCRDALILAAHVTHGYRVVQIARFLTMNPSTVSKALDRARNRTVHDSVSDTSREPRFDPQHRHAVRSRG